MREVRESYSECAIKRRKGIDGTESTNMSSLYTSALPHLSRGNGEMPPPTTPFMSKGFVTCSVEESGQGKTNG